MRWYQPRFYDNHILFQISIIDMRKMQKFQVVAEFQVIDKEEKENGCIML